MPFLTDKVMEGRYVRLRHVQVEDAEAILAARGDGRVSSTWRHHLPTTLEEERNKLRAFVEDEDRWQYLITSKEKEELVAVIGLETNTKKDQNEASRFGPWNCRVAKLGMLLLREDPWNHHCEKEAIRLLLDATFHQELKTQAGENFKICDVVVRANIDDELTIGVLIMLGFKIPNINKVEAYHGRDTILMDYSPPHSPNEE